MESPGMSLDSEGSENIIFMHAVCCIIQSVCANIIQLKHAILQYYVCTHVVQVA